jgi:hypothetical protein
VARGDDPPSQTAFATAAVTLASERHAGRGNQEKRNQCGTKCFHRSLLCPNFPALIDGAGSPTLRLQKLELAIEAGQLLAGIR